MPEISTQHNQLEYSVSEIAGAIKRVVEDAFGHVRLRGEISGLKVAASGHMYLTLKDDKAVIDGVCWKGTASSLNFKPEDGLEVICTGRVTTYGGRSKYQIIIERMEPAGVGALMALLEKRKKALAAEGLFAPERKKPLPFMPQVIGVVTSPTGAVIRDILHRLTDRFPVHVLVWPVMVQGEGAAEQVANAVKGFNEEKGVPRPDVLIVARGGGSIEDLWAFNEEVVVRAVAASEIPVISAVGHETDTTLVDYVSDLRAPTPTAAAEFAVPVREEWRLTLADYGTRTARALQRNLNQKREWLEHRARGLERLPSLLEQASQRFDDWVERLALALPKLVRAKEAELKSFRLQPHSLRTSIKRHEQDLARASQQLDAAFNRRIEHEQRTVAELTRVLATLDYKKVLARGFVVVRDAATGKVATRAAQVQDGQALELQFADGQQVATAHEGGTTPKKTSAAKPAKRTDAKPKQESLF